MRGSLVKRHANSWSLVISHGYIIDPATGKRRRKQKWHTFVPTPGTSAREARKQAEAKLAELLGQVATGAYVEPAKLSFLDYLRQWHQKAVAPLKRPNTASLYKQMIETHVAASRLAAMPIQKLRTVDLEEFYASVTLAPVSVGVLHAIIHRALKTAVRDRLLVANPAAAVEHRPRAPKDHQSEGARVHCWSAADARRFLDAARQASPQVTAFAYLALDSGARRNELLGLAWSAVDLGAGTVRIARQLDTAGPSPTFGPTKTGRARTVALGAETLARLREHKRAQAVLKLANRPSYQDHGLVFAMEPEHLQTPRAALGQPCPQLADRVFRRLVKAAGLPPMRFHALRHTSATLALGAGVPVHVVAARLGHLKPSMTLEVYAHALPNMQQDAAAKLGAVFAGR